MSEHPILFSGPMVRAILAGQKTMTRRVVNGEALKWLTPDTFPPAFVADWNGLCPYGVPGDLLWVREAFMPRPGFERVSRPHYRADDDRPEWRGLWKPSIHMPRWASRITLRVTDVRVERVQEITEGDAVREGVQAIPEAPASLTDRTAFASLWDSLNAKRGHGWDVNPWVWVVSFERAAPTPESQEEG